METYKYYGQKQGVALRRQAAPGRKKRVMESTRAKMDEVLRGSVIKQEGLGRFNITWGSNGIRTKP
jgi:hypothetical protein